VNPGNSGGPLFNLKGEVIGINSQIYSRSGGYQGLSFAIPINVALKVKDQIVAKGSVQHARLGVSVQELNQALAESFGLKRPEGALVATVQAGSAAEHAGIQPGDVIVKFDGKPIGAASELSAAVGQASPGDKVTLEIQRKGDKRELTATLGAAKSEKVAQSGNAAKDQGRLGLAVRPLTPEERKEANVQGGLLVEESGGLAARAGVQPGDIVLMAGGKAVGSVAELRAATAGNGTVALLVQRGESRIFVPMKLG
jgi:serine protease Do